jgi:hypothetical protein
MGMGGATGITMGDMGMEMTVGATMGEEGRGMTGLSIGTDRMGANEMDDALGNRGAWTPGAVNSIEGKGGATGIGIDIGTGVGGAIDMVGATTAGADTERAGAIGGGLGMLTLTTGGFILYFFLEFRFDIWIHLEFYK